MDHKFKFGEQDAVMRTGTNRDRSVRRLISQKLVRACGGNEGISEVDSDAMWEYATILSTTTPLEVTWWRDASESAERLYEGYALFADDDGEQSDVLRQAARELAASREKKVTKSS